MSAQGRSCIVTATTITKLGGLVTVRYGNPVSTGTGRTGRQRVSYPALGRSEARRVILPLPQSAVLLLAATPRRQYSRRQRFSHREASQQHHVGLWDGRCHRQRELSNVFAVDFRDGLEIGDAVLVKHKWGRVKEICQRDREAAVIKRKRAGAERGLVA